MRMTPLEFTCHSFARRMRGLDPEEVERFLEMVSDDYEELIRENEMLRTRIAHLEGENRQLKTQEELLKQTLVNAQAISDKMRESAEKECSALLGEAEIRAEKIVDASHRRAARIASDIRDLKGLRSRLAESLRSSLDIHRNLIDSIESDPEHEALIEGSVEARIAYLRASDAGSDSTVAPRPAQQLAAQPDAAAPGSEPAAESDDSAKRRPIGSSAWAPPPAAGA